MNYIVFDLEFNQPFRINRKTRQLERGYVNSFLPQEIIEIGAVKLDNKFNILDTFRIFVKPEVYKYLHPKVKKLTNITKEDLEYSFPFSNAVKYFKSWVGNDDYILCSWTTDDIIGMKLSCNYYHINDDWIKEYIDIQLMFGNKFNLTEQISLKNAIEKLNIELNKNIHKALNDSLYTAEIFRKINLDNIDPISIEKINNYVMNTKNFQVGRRISLDDERINKRKLICKCPECGRFTNKFYKWKGSPKRISTISYCNKCDIYFNTFYKIRDNGEQSLVYNKEVNIANISDEIKSCLINKE